MKKYTLLLFVLAFIFGLFNVNYTSAANCASGESFNTTTGQSCGNTTAVVGCVSCYLFSPITGQPCVGTNSGGASQQFGSAGPLTMNQFNSLYKNYFVVGSRGNDVRVLQQFLKEQGYYFGNVDGNYGRITARAVSDFKGDNVAYFSSNPNMAGGLCPTGKVWYVSSCVPTSYYFSNPKIDDLEDSCPTGQTWIGSGCVSQPQSQSSIRVISPNGGQTIKQGQTITIKWLTNYIPPNAMMNINLSNSNGIVGQIATGLSPITSQSYSWNTASAIGTISTISGQIPEYSNPGQYNIDLEVYWPVAVTADNQKGMAGVKDSSDDYFTLTDSLGNLPAAPTISLSTPPSVPNDGVTVETIQGSGFNSSSAVYFSDATYRNAYKTIPSSVSSSGQSLTFVIAQNPSSPPASQSQYQMMVSNDGVTMSNPSSLLITAASPRCPISGCSVNPPQIQPTITSISPASASAGSSVTIYGSGFDKLSFVVLGGENKQGLPFVSINPTSVTPTSLTFIVPFVSTDPMYANLVLSGNYTIQVGEAIKGVELSNSANLFINNQTTNTTNPDIGTITPSSAPVGTTIEIKGSGLSGFEGDVYFYFERADGKKVRLPGTLSQQFTGDGVGSQLARVIIKEPCQSGQTVYGDYSGIPSLCDYVQLTPGVYKVYTQPWGKMSNVENFTITSS